MKPRRSTSQLTMTDFYCGAGGSSTGAVMAGVEVKSAANHWKLALDTHNHNHPRTNHYMVDILATSPAIFPYTPIAWFSPECTAHTLSAGRKRKGASQLGLFEQKKPDPAEERSRVTMWDVVRFSEYHKYQVVIVENVVDIKYWQPFPAWLQAMELLGYKYKICYFNTMFFHPLNGQSDFAPQNRDRLYVVFWRKGNRAPCLDFRPLAWCDSCQKNIQALQTFKKPVFPRGHYDTTGSRGQYFYACPDCVIKEGGVSRRRVEPYYYAAWNCIDWSIPITRIGDRKEALKPNTLRRIAVGLDKYGSQPLLIELSRSQDLNNRSSTLTSPSPTQTTRQSLAFIMPFKGEPEYQHIRSASGVFPTQTTSGAPGIVSVPMIVEMYGGGSARPGTEALNTVTAGGQKSGILSLPGSFIFSYYSRDDVLKPVDEAMPTIVCDNRFALVMPQTPFIASYYNGSDQVHPLNEFIPTVSTVDRHSVIVPSDKLEIEDCGFRMFEPDECKDAQGFSPDYFIYGTRKEQVKQIGNAVSTPPAEFQIRAVAESLER